MKSEILTNKKKLRLLLCLSVFFVSLMTANIAYCYQNTFLPFYQHSISSLQTNGELLEFDDGSIWKVHPSYRNEIYKWCSGDVIELSQSTNNYNSTYRFWITNKTINSYVLAEISQGPILDHYCTQHLQYISQGHLTIVAGSGLETTWVADSRDAHLLAGWKLGQTIIVGVNNSWFNWFSGSDILLYNVEKNHFIRGHLQ